MKKRRTNPDVVRKWIAENQGKHLCGCGCGGVIVIKIHHHTRGIPKYLNGHTSRVANPMSGRCGETNPHYLEGRYVNKAGYVQVLIPGPGRSKYALEHRMVVEAFLKRKLEPDETVHHKNGNKTDNRLENLEVKQNADHSAHHARRGETGFRRQYQILGRLAPRGEESGFVKLKEADVREIRASSGIVSVKDFAAQFGVTENAIRHVLKRKTWKHVP